MTSNERKIINCLWETKEKTHIRLITQKANLSSDYARLLCRSLARSGHIKFENDLAHLLKKGRSRFENNDPVADEPMAVAANVTLLTDEPVAVSPASDRSDEDESQEEGASEDKDKPASGDEELDRALADLEPSSQKNADEETKIADAEAELKPEPEEEIKEKEPASEAGTETKAKAVEIEEEKKTMPQEMDEEIKIKPADNPALAASLENPEKAVPKEESAKPSSGFGISFKKIVNWFAEKK